MNRLDETNVCYLCEITHDCAEGNEVKALGGEWVCLSCQDKLISELAPKWVSVEDELPEDGAVVLAFKKASDNREWFYLCDYDDGEFIVPKLGVFEPQCWMTLPIPPKANKLEGGNDLQDHA